MGGDSPRATELPARGLDWMGSGWAVRPERTATLRPTDPVQSNRSIKQHIHTYIDNILHFHPPDDEEERPRKPRDPDEVTRAHLAVERPKHALPQALCGGGGAGEATAAAGALYIYGCVDVWVLFYFYFLFYRSAFRQSRRLCAPIPCPRPTQQPRINAPCPRRCRRPHPRRRCYWRWPWGCAATRP